LPTFTTDNNSSTNQIGSGSSNTTGTGGFDESTGGIDPNYFKEPWNQANPYSLTDNQAQSTDPQSFEAFNQALEANSEVAPYADLAALLLQETPVGPLVTVLNDAVQSTSNASDAVGLATGSSSGSVEQINQVVGVGGGGIMLVVGEAAAAPVALVTTFVATVTRGSQWMLNQIVPQYYESMPVNLPGAPQYSIGSGLSYAPDVP
jgi:hypothetical protein